MILFSNIFFQIWGNTTEKNRGKKALDKKKEREKEWSLNFL